MNMRIREYMNRRICKGRALLMLLASALLTLGSCVDFDDATQPVSVTIQLQRPAGFSESASLAGLTVTLSSAEETATALTDAAGCAVFSELAPGTYDVSVSADVSHSQYEQFMQQPVGGDMDFMLSGTLVGQVLNGDAVSLSLPLMIYPQESLIIGKIYFSTSKLEKGSYSVGKYIELYNNSADSVDAAGLYIGILEGESTVAYKVYPYDEAQSPDTLYMKQIFRIPAGQPVMVAPGGTLLIVNSATDHSSQNQWESDLRGADFEAKDINNKVPNNNQVTALEQVFTTYASISNMNLVSGGSTVVIFRTDEDVTQWKSVRAYGKTTGSNFFKQVPAHLVLDGVDVLRNKAGTGPDINSKRLFQYVDAGYTFVTAPSANAGERLVRKTMAVAPDGRRILQDTNNSLNDFVCNDTISPRVYMDR